MKGGDLEPGTNLLAEFSDSLNVKKLKAGDRVKAKLSQDLMVGGQILAPNHSRLVGHVIEARSRTASGQESRLGVVFDRVLLKHHKELKFQAVVQALAAPVQGVSRPDSSEPAMPPARGSAPLSSPRRGGSMPPFGTGAPSSRGPLGANGLTERRRGSQGPRSTSSLSSGSGMHGVYGIKDLKLSSAADGGPGVVIASVNSDVTLENGTQVLLRVAGR
jgi:hypothetical protein